MTINEDVPEQSYWNYSGKHQDILDKGNEVMPSIGYTPNPDVNLFIAMSHVYYDLYNNGACNIQSAFRDVINKYILPKMPEFDAFRVIDEDYAYTEKQMDKMLELINGKSLDYPVHTAWFHPGNLLVSEQEPQNKEGWAKVTFGLKEERDAWINGRIEHLDYTKVEQKEPHPSLSDITKESSSIDSLKQEAKERADEKNQTRTDSDKLQKPSSPER